MKPWTKGTLLLAAVAVPSLLAAGLVFGCCILPFHKYLHAAMPLCNLASAILSGHPDGNEQRSAQPATAPRSHEKVSAAAPATLGLNPFFGTTDGTRARLETARSDPRSFISLGAVRCEDDVGLLLLLTTFRI